MQPLVSVTEQSIFLHHFITFLHLVKSNDIRNKLTHQWILLIKGNTMIQVATLLKIGPDLQESHMLAQA